MRETVPIAPPDHAPFRRVPELLGRLHVSRIAQTLALGALVRFAIFPLTHGHDFDVWNAATRLLLHGVNPYSHWRSMPNAYPYLPVFLYLLLPFQWLAVHTGIPFTLLGKVPIALADLTIGFVLYRRLLDATGSTRTAITAACLYLFNPLVLYNSAFLGRFDAVASAFLLVALRGNGARFAVPYGLAVATKTFPIFILPALLAGRYRRSRGELLGTLAVIVAVSAPFLIWDAGALFANLARATAGARPLPAGLSWQFVLLWVLPASAYGYLVPVLYALFLAAVWWWRDRPPLMLCALTFSAFVLVDHKVWEQYLTWPLPFLIALALLRRDVAPGLLAAGMTLASLFMNEQAEPIDRFYYLHLIPYPPIAVNVLLALGIIAYIVRTMRSPEPAIDGPDRHQGHEPGHGR